MMVNLKRVRLELARTAEYPEGSSEHGYEFIAPVNNSGHIDADDWKKVKELCHVTRVAGEETEKGCCVMPAEAGDSIMVARIKMTTSRFSNLTATR